MQSSYGAPDGPPTTFGSSNTPGTETSVAGSVAAAVNAVMNALNTLPSPRKGAPLIDFVRTFNEFVKNRSYAPLTTLAGSKALATELPQVFAVTPLTATPLSLENA